MFVLFFFFFKQKTAYEMRISDWSSDVCSSDLDTAEPLLRLTVHGLLQRTVERHGSRDALVVRHQNIRWSYHDLARAVDALAAGLLALGLPKGDRIGIWSPKRVEWVGTKFATARLGLNLVTINPTYRRDEPAFHLNKAKG